jgi:hypothetical protein
MTNQSLKFWVRCPHCRKPLGVEPRFVWQYLRRVIDSRKHRLGAIEELLMDAQAQIRPPQDRAAKERAG